MSAVTWPEKEIHDFEEYITELGLLNAHWPNRSRGLFRGQADASWSLKPTLARMVEGAPQSDVVELEDELLHSFRNQCGSFIPDHYIPTIPQDLLVWWPLMRHYGAPTRVLDWTLSGYVALYFAVLDEWEKPGAVWFVTDTVHSHSFTADEVEMLKCHRNLILRYDKLRDPTAERAVVFYEVTRQMDRVAAQQGWFSVCYQPACDHAESILRNAQNQGSANHLMKFIIPAAAKPDFLRQLHMMNITAKSLFPGVDGLGRSIQENARLSLKFGGSWVSC